jgi:hypothetical protein
VTPSPRGRPSTPFLCRASPITHGNQLCRALPFPKTHGKVLYRVKMSRAPFAVRFGKRRTAKAVSCVFVPLPCGKERDYGSALLQTRAPATLHPFSGEGKIGHRRVREHELRHLRTRASSDVVRSLTLPR